MTSPLLRKGPSGPPTDVPGEFEGDGTVRSNEDGELEAIPGTVEGQLWFYDGVTWLPTTTGPANGQIARWDDTALEWEFIDLPPSGSIPPLTNTFYVDSDTLVDPADQDGSIALPYSTLQAAIDAAAEIPFSSFVKRALILVAPSTSPLSPGAGDGFFVANYEVQLTIKGLGSKPSTNGNTNVARIGALTSEDPPIRSPSYTFDSVYIDSITIFQRSSESQTSLFFYNSCVEGNVVCSGKVVANDTNFVGTVTPSVQATNCTFGEGENTSFSGPGRIYGAIAPTSINGIPGVDSSSIDAITQALLNRHDFDFSAGIPRLDHSTVQGSANLSAQVDNIAALDLFDAAPTSGLYEVDVYLTITNPSTGGTGALQVDIEYNDPIAIRSLSSETVDITTLGFLTFHALIRIAGGTNVTFATSGIVTPDDLTYDVRAVVRLVEY